ncbi:sex determination protein fox-1 isoform X1 [Hydra vulgaris]|uniref:RNA binding protein fox-1 homolog 1 n=1 Tax=Hydra vulgaris TaxID=6087 RepID=T2M3Y8_HYDVU|nr:sex determination protein fox-1 [Hydra vulgaris]XP_047143428.1 sex determination protein fox-1 [Hydra vulgaris]XP_047143429.1 sex determination protein fox-1 [Hydra vulgaris]
MIFNIGENPTMDVLRMILHYSLQQNKADQVSLQTILPTAEQPITRSPSPHKENDGNRRLHVTNLPFKIKDVELKQYFEGFGPVQDAEIIYNERGSKGFGFVTMVTEADAIKAKEALNGKEIDGRKIEINYATPKTSSKVRSKGGRSPSAQSNQANRIIRTAPVYPNCQQHIKQTVPVIQPYQMAPPPIPSLATLSASLHNPLLQYQHVPTPEQYAQYYHYLTTQGAVHNPYQTANNAAYRYQPY